MLPRADAARRRTFPLVSLVVLAATVWACGPKKPTTAPNPPPLPADAYTYYLRGRLAAVEGNAKRAALEFGRAAQVAPGEPEIIVAYLEALVDARRLDDAMVVGAQASKTWPKRADIALAHGHALRKARQNIAAIERLELAVKLANNEERGKRDELDAPLSDRAMLELATALVEAGKVERAAAVYRKIAERDPDALKPRLRLARLLIDAGLLEKARPVIEEVLAKRPDSTSARLLHSRLFVGLGDRKAAVKTLRDGFIASSKRARTARRVFERLMEDGYHERAAQFALAVDSPDLSPDLRAALGRFLLRVGRSSSALSLATSVRSSNPKSLEAALLLGSALARLRRFGEAATAAQSVPLTPYSRIVTAEWLTLAGKRQDAKRLANELPKDDPQRAFILARIHELVGETKRARATFQAATKQWPDNIDLAFEAASFELRAGDPQRAVDIASPLLATDPSDATLANFVGFAIAESGTNLERADELLSIALRRYPDDPNVLDSYGWLLFQQNQLTDAARTLRRAWRLAPAEPEILYHLARTESRLGLRVAARRRFQRAYSLALEPWLRQRIKGHLDRLSAR